MMRIAATLQKRGDCVGLIIPVEILNTAHFNVNETVVLTADETGILIQKAQAAETLDDLFRNYNDKSSCKEFDTGVPIGIEVW